jgi:hypothetical protein
MKQYDKIEKQIKTILEAMSNKTAASKWSNSEWTGQIKDLICKLGENEGCHVCASGTKKKERWGEWLYDVTWFKNDKKDKFIAYFPLVLECEWGDEKEVIYDFQKLLLARSRHRVIIFGEERKKSNAQEIIEKLKEEVRRFTASQSGDRYFFAGWDYNTDKFEFDLLVL